MALNTFFYPWMRKGLFFGVGLFLWLGVGALSAAPTEYQIKALFLYNFTKYVDWPASSFSAPDSPLVVGIYGDDNFGGNLESAIEGKSVNGHPLVIQHISSSSGIGNCSILFVSASEKSNLAAILSKAANSPVLTVGEDDGFLDKGGIINFVLTDGKVHIDINLQMARQVNLSISSKLLSIADHVKE